VDEIKFELTNEQREQIRKVFAEVKEQFATLFDTLVELAKVVMEAIRRIAEQLGRFFLKMQLLEWHIPMRMAEFVSQKVSWFWAVKLGFNWFKRKMAMIE
jgi:hypothetical protein